MPEHPERLLPEVFRRTAWPGSPLSALLEATGTLLDPAEAVIADIDAVFDPYRTPAALLPYLASWLDLDRYLRPGAAGPASVFPAGEGALRNLVARTAALGRTRGTAASLTGMLEIATHLGGFAVEENVSSDGAEAPFHLLIRAPPEAAALAELVEQIVAAEKPAYLTHEVIYTAGGIP